MLRAKIPLHRLATRDQQRTFAKIVPPKLRRLNPHHPRIHHNDAPHTVVRKALSTSASRKRTQSARHRRAHAHIPRYDVTAIVGMLVATVALVLSRHQEQHTSICVCPSATGTTADVLIKKMTDNLPAALTELKNNSVKRSHWIWWAFPTEKKGVSEPKPKTCVSSSTVEYVVEKAPDVWFTVLRKMTTLLNSKDRKTFVDSLSNDTGRMKCFAEFWKPIADKNITNTSKAKAETNDDTIQKRWEDIEAVCLAINNHIN